MVLPQDPGSRSLLELEEFIFTADRELELCDVLQATCQQLELRGNQLMNFMSGGKAALAYNLYREFLSQGVWHFIIL